MTRQRFGAASLRARHFGAAGIVLLAIVAGLALRLTRLDARPMHHDEANQAVKFGALLETGEYRYDPQDHHGPTLYYLSLPSAWIRGQHTLASLDERTLRAVPALFGAATILLVLLLVPAVDRIAVATAAWLMALSPAMVFYSRMFIQESLFACFALAFVIAAGRMATTAALSWSVLAGVAAGLALATKETSVIVLPAAVLSCAIAWWSLRPAPTVGSSTEARWRPVIIAAAIATALAALFYSAFLSSPRDILAPLSGAGTYLSRGMDRAFHAQPWHYYVGLLAYFSSGGLRWSEGAVLLLALVGAIDAWRSPRTSANAADEQVTVESRFWARYLTLYVAFVAGILSVIPYKTPWNLLPFYVCTLVLAGMGFSALVQATVSRIARVALTAALVIASVHLGWQAWRGSLTYAADPRNPYVYAQTVPDAVRMAARIRALAGVHPDGLRTQVSVLASPYEQWPLPWYLRTMSNVGYWTAPGDPLALKAPIIVSSMENAASLDERLGERYTSEFYGLRPNVLMTLYIERGLWDRFLAVSTGPSSPAP